MLYEAFELLVLPVPSPEEAAKPFERLGLPLSPLTRAKSSVKASACSRPAPGANRFSVEFLAIADAQLEAGKTPALPCASRIGRCPAAAGRPRCDCAAPVVYQRYRLAQSARSRGCKARAAAPWRRCR